VQNLVNLKAEAGRRHVHQLEGTDRVPEPELAGGIDVFGRCHAFVDETNRLDDEGVKDTVHRETDHVLDTDRVLPAARQSRIAASTVSSAVSRPGITSTSFMRDTGEK